MKKLKSRKLLDRYRACPASSVSLPESASSRSLRLHGFRCFSHSYSRVSNSYLLLLPTYNFRWGHHDCYLMAGFFSVKNGSHPSGFRFRVFWKVFGDFTSQLIVWFAALFYLIHFVMNFCGSFPSSFAVRNCIPFSREAAVRYSLHESL